MYIPPLFREDDRATLIPMIRGARFSILVSNGADGFPEVSYLPLLFDEADGANGSLLGHFARAKMELEMLVPSTSDAEYAES
jgi:transcriptional regulator